MWFRTAHRPASELTTRHEAFSARPGAGGSVALQSPPYSVDDVRGRRAPLIAETNVAAAPMDLRVRYRESEQFKPSPGQWARNLVIEAGAPNEVSAAYKLLRTQLMKRLQENHWNTVAVTSPTRGSGTTLTAINLAISIARDLSSSVCLVELDLANPSFQQVLGFHQRRGLVDHLVHDVPISELTLSPGIDRLSLIPAGSPVTNSSELLASPRMARLVEELKRRHESGIVLFDLPSVLTTDDVMAFSPLVDCALLVVEEGETKVNDVRQAQEYLRPTPTLGVVLNRSIHVENDGRMIHR